MLQKYCFHLYLNFGPSSIKSVLYFLCRQIFDSLWSIMSRFPLLWSLLDLAVSFSSLTILIGLFLLLLKSCLLSFSWKVICFFHYDLEFSCRVSVLLSPPQICLFCSSLGELGKILYIIHSLLIFSGIL